MIVLALVVLTQWPQQQCVTTNGTAACGYDCKTTNGRAACARTPLGACITTNGQIFCNDPPNAVLRAGAGQQMSCVTTNGNGACGYDCKTTNGNAACAQTPWGRCITTNGRIFCNDPSRRVIATGEVAQMDCRTTNGVGACGYDCKAANGTVACASVPWGRCVTTNGRVFCSE
jgi:hypothetical protein